MPLPPPRLPLLWDTQQVAGEEPLQQAQRQQNQPGCSCNGLGSRDEFLSQEEEMSEDPKGERKPQGEGVIEISRGGNVQDGLENRMAQ